MLKQLLAATFILAATVQAADAGGGPRRGHDAFLIPSHGHGHRFHHDDHRHAVPPGHWKKRHRHHHDDTIVINRSYYYGNAGYMEPMMPLISRSRGSYVQVNCTGRQPITETIIGGTIGGLAGHQIGKGNGKTAATIGGAILGSIIGNNLAYADRYCAGQTLDYAPVGTRVVWQSPADQMAYAVTPTREFRTAGRYCREYQAAANVGGKVQETYGTACMQPDGSWEIVN